VTILILVLFGAILVSALVDVYSRKRHYVDTEIIKLNAYEEAVNELGLPIFGDHTCSSSEECKDILVKDFFDIIRSASIKLVFSYDMVNATSY
jgi:hypothetical protein